MSLPDGYTQVEYIESTGTQWIDTGVAGSNNANFEIDFLTKSVVGPSSTDFGTIFGACVLTSTRINLGTWNSSQVTTGGEMCWGSGNYNPYITSNVRMQVSIKGTTLTTPNGTQAVSGSFTTGCNIWLFCRNYNGTADQFSKTQLYSFKIYNGSTLIRDFVPCLDSSGVAGLYDTVNNKFYRNSGSGVFSYGNLILDEADITEVEYIESSGTQYIDTGYIPAPNTRVLIDMDITAASTAKALFGARTSANVGFLMFTYANNAGFQSDYGSQQLQPIGSTSSGRHMIDKNGASVTVDDVLIGTHSAATFTIPHTLFLFSVNKAGTAMTSYSCTAKLYSCKIYEGSVLVRDYLPCIDSSGTVGLYDTVNELFYRNSGTGVFTAGAVVITVPPNPENLSASVSGAEITLTWNASENASGYRIYENGVLIGDTAQTTLTADARHYSNAVYIVTAYNDKGESSGSVLRIYTSGGRDVLDDLITDRTLADVTGRTKKGVYNASDVNRVSDAAQRVKMLLSPLGYSTADVSEYRWSANEVPTAEEMAAYYRSAAGQDVLNYAAAKEKLPGSVKNLDYTGANAIEMMLRLTGRAAERIPEGYIYSGEIYGGDG